MKAREIFKLINGVAPDLALSIDKIGMGNCVRVREISSGRVRVVGVAAISGGRVQHRFEVSQPAFLSFRNMTSSVRPVFHC